MSKDRSARSASRTGHESRRSSVATPERESRDNADAERHDDQLGLSAEDRDAILRNDAMQNLLPQPPKKAGMHFFYASMNNPQHVAWYKRMGYRAVRVDDPAMAGWVESAMKGASGEYAGCITINEMLLMEISQADYQRYMKIVHHDKPLEEQGAVRNAIETTKESTNREAGHSVVQEVGSGLNQMDRRVKTPSKFEG